MGSKSSSLVRLLYEYLFSYLLTVFQFRFWRVPNKIPNNYSRFVDFFRKTYICEMGILIKHFKRLKHLAMATEDLYEFMSYWDCVLKTIFCLFSFLDYPARHHSTNRKKRLAADRWSWLSEKDIGDFSIDMSSTNGRQSTRRKTTKTRERCSPCSGDPTVGCPTNRKVIFLTISIYSTKT